MRKLIISILALFFFFPFVSNVSGERIDQHEDTVTESIWDWLTTLGKSSKEKKIIKNKRRNERIRRRVREEKEAIHEERRKENEFREAEAQKIRDLRLKKQRERVKAHKSQKE